MRYLSWAELRALPADALGDELHIPHAHVWRVVHGCCGWPWCSPSPLRLVFVQPEGAQLPQCATIRFSTWTDQSPSDHRVLRLSPDRCCVHTTLQTAWQTCSGCRGHLESMIQKPRSHGHGKLASQNIGRYHKSLMLDRAWINARRYKALGGTKHAPSNSRTNVPRPRALFLSSLPPSALGFHDTQNTPSRNLTHLCHPRQD